MTGAFCGESLKLREQEGVSAHEKFNFYVSVLKSRETLTTGGKNAIYSFYYCFNFNFTGSFSQGKLHVKEVNFKLCYVSQCYGMWGRMQF